jgi:hypothetical protein
MSLTPHRCRCGAEFCYVCGKKWRICQCPYFGTNSLAAMANGIAVEPDPQGNGDDNGIVFDDQRLWPFLDDFLQPVQVGAAQPPQDDGLQPVPAQGLRPGDAFQQRRRELDAELQANLDHRRLEEHQDEEVHLDPEIEADIERRIDYLARRDLSNTPEQVEEQSTAITAIRAHLWHDVNLPIDRRGILAFKTTLYQLLLDLPSRLRPDGHDERQLIRDNNAQKPWDDPSDDTPELQRQLANALRQITIFYSEFSPNHDRPGERERFNVGFQDRLGRAMRQRNPLQRRRDFEALVRFIEENIPPRLAQATPAPRPVQADVLPTIQHTTPRNQTDGLLTLKPLHTVPRNQTDGLLTLKPLHTVPRNQTDGLLPLKPFHTVPRIQNDGLLLLKPFHTVPLTHIDGLLPLVPFPTTSTQQQDTLNTTSNIPKDRRSCGHLSWDVIPGAFYCEWCLRRMTTHIYKCTGCHCQACLDCRCRL